MLLILRAAEIKCSTITRNQLSDLYRTEQNYLTSTEVQRQAAFVTVFTAPLRLQSHLKMQVFETKPAVNVLLKSIIVCLGTNERCFLSVNNMKQLGKFS